MSSKQSSEDGFDPETVRGRLDKLAYADTKDKLDRYLHQAAEYGISQVEQNIRNSYCNSGETLLANVKEIAMLRAKAVEIYIDRNNQLNKQLGELDNSS